MSNRSWRHPPVTESYKLRKVKKRPQSARRTPVLRNKDCEYLNALLKAEHIHSSSVASRYPSYRFAIVCMTTLLSPRAPSADHDNNRHRRTAHPPLLIHQIKIKSSRLYCIIYPPTRIVMSFINIAANCIWLRTNRPVVGPATKWALIYTVCL